jgi:hypothetical protein
MSPTARYVVLGTFAVVISVSAVAVGRHHRPFSKAPATSHMAPHTRAIMIDQHQAIEQVPVVSTST